MLIPSKRKKAERQINRGFPVSRNAEIRNAAVAASKREERVRELTIAGN